MTEGLSASDVALLSGGNNRNDGMFGDGGGAWWLIILFLFMFAGGWGNGFGGGANNPGFQGYATRADINEGFAFNNIDAGIRAITQGICDSTYALNNAIQGGFNAVQMSTMQGFNGVERGLSSLSSQLAMCCCDIERGIDGVNYNMATNTCALQNTMNTNTRDIIESQNAGTRAILDFLTQDKIDALRSENNELRRAASQDRQNAYLTTAMTEQTNALISRIAPYPVPSYNVPNPNACCNNQYGWNGGWNSCGCGC